MIKCILQLVGTESVERTGDSFESDIPISGTTLGIVLLLLSLAPAERRELQCINLNEIGAY